MKTDTTRHLAILVVCTVCSWPTKAQSQADLIPDTFDASLLAGSPQLALLLDQKVDAFDYLQASISVEDKAAKVNWAPFLPVERYSFWSESRLQIGQKDKLTLLGVSLQYNPLNPRSSNGQSKWQGVVTESDDPVGLLTEKERTAERLEAAIASALTVGATGCIPLPESPDEIDSFVQGLVAKSASPPAGPALVIVQCGLIKATSTGDSVKAKIEGLEPNDPNRAALAKKLASLGKAKATFLALAERAYLSQRSPQEIAQLLEWRAQSLQLRGEVKTARDTFASRTYLRYREALLHTHRPVINLSIVNTLFSVLGGSRLDADHNGLDDNDHSTKSRSVALSADWHLGERNGLSFLASRSNERASAEAGSKTADYNGLGLTWASVAKTLNEAGYKDSADFKESLFVPMIAVGLSYEIKDCASADSHCTDGILRSQALTPFVDLKLSKLAQFRLGVPLQRQDRLDTSNAVRSVGVVTLIALQLGMPK